MHFICDFQKFQLQGLSYIQAFSNVSLIAN